ncbi:MAG: sodium:solute symporter [Bacteroidota bacterium]
MPFLDYLVIAVYLGLMVGVGLYVQRKASAGIEGFFLGNRKIPWWALGASGMASNLDVSGTMIIAALVYAIGVQGFYIEIRGGVVLVMAFLMVFMGKWNRRSQVMTVAEWMTFRFGEGPQGKAARLLSATANLVFTVGAITYFAQGLGIFVGTLLGIPPAVATYAMIALATVYTVASGLYGVVYTDVFQGVLIFFVVIYVCAYTFTGYSLPDAFDVSVPLGAGAFETVRTSLAQWADWRPSWTLDLPGEYAQYNLFGVAVMFYMLKVMIEGFSGSGGYMIQRFFASSSDREAGLLSLFWITLLAFRWPFVISIAILGIVYGVENGAIANPEEVLPIVIMEYMPVGIRGLLIAGLIAAAMSTFDSTVNSGAAYWVKDIYQYLIKPEADEKTLVWQGRAASILLVLIGVAFTFAFDSLNDVWGWLTMGLGAGIMIPQLVRWYWWRFNGYGYAGGTFAGMVLAIVVRLFFDLDEISTFIAIAAGTFFATIVCTLVTQPTDDATLTRFYEITKPFGFWGHIASAMPTPAATAIRSETRQDLISLAVAVPWQLCLFLTPMVFMTKQWPLFWPLFASLGILTVLLYVVWFRRLKS